MDYHKIAQALMPPEDCAAFVFISFMSLVSFQVWSALSQFVEFEMRAGTSPPQF